ncbi:hypothetical protein FK85_24860 [Halorubrum saccharovorum]|uniref:HTH marR-type domain-containing protein n=1 Tax=Halorubrum saccharovorum TaxID=2248 RepID=A0A0F8CLW8_9EURY|nr:hypothetical protein [Halorubrum saccharovorum]KKF39902.1 hypothetical protein FK85_24860 [Halorubrum saccharovorum]
MSAERKKLTPTQQAILHKASENPDWSNTKIADSVGCSSSHVSRTLNKWEPEEMDDDGTVPDPSSGYTDSIPEDEVDSGIYPVAILAVSLGWILGVGMMVAGTDSIFLLGMFVAFGTWLALPVVIALDAISLHNQKAPFRPNRIVWPAVSLVLGVIGGVGYLATRVSNLSLGISS